MMKQYFEIKEQYKDTILFFRLGDFYEMFFDDAILVSKELELTLTGRDCGQDERAPMCGVPYHACETYLARLIAKGYKVAICEQMEDPAKAKGLVKRDIIRVVTPGTVIESSMLDDAKNNYIGSIFLRGKEAGVCFADISTGVCHATQLTEGDLAGGIIGELCRFAPSELLFNSEILKHKEITAYVKDHMSCSVELLDEADYEPKAAEERMRGQFGPGYEQAVGVRKNSVAFYSLSALLAYLAGTQKRGIERLKTVEVYSGSQYMQLSPVTRANLELTETMRGREKKGTLLWVLDKTQTAMGKRLVRSWIEQPLLDAEAINERLDGVEELYKKNVLRADLRDTLSHVFDLERLMTRVIYGSATPRELLALAATCTRLPDLLALLAGFAAGALWALLPTLFAGRNLTSLSVATIMMNSIAALLTEYIVKSYFQRPGASNTETVVVNEGSILPRIFPSTQFNYGILVALFCVAVVTWMLYKTPFGFSLRAMGSNPRAMQQAGLPIYGRTIAAMCISGGLFALGGSIQCLAVYKRFVMGFSPGYGWDGITVATLAMNSPVGVLLSAFLFGMLRSASISMSLTSQVTTEMISVLQGFIVMLVASPDVWNVLGHLWQRLKSCVGRGRKQEGAAE